MAFRPHLVCLALLVTWSASHVTHASSWCRMEEIDAFSSALAYLGLPPESDVIPETQVQEMIVDAFTRAGCENQFLGTKTCNDCLLAENIFELLRVDTAIGLDAGNFAKAITVIVHYMHQLPTMCNLTDSIDWGEISYGTVVHEFVEFAADDHDHDHSHDFTKEQLEALVMAVNETYLPGETDANGDIVEPAPGFCEEKSFRSGDVYTRAAVEHPGTGVSEDELGNMNSILLFYLLRGDCIREDLRVESELPEPDDFIFSLFEQYADADTCLIVEEEFEHLLMDLRILSDHDHDHDHDHFRASPGTQDDHDHDHDHGIPNAATSCLSSSDLASVFGMDLSVGLSREDVEAMSPMLLQQAAQGCAYVAEEEEDSRPDAGAVWGYSILSVLIVSAFAPLGLIITRWSTAPAYKYIMTLFMGLGMGSLAGDALLHLVPEAMGEHDHSGDDHGHDSEDMWKMFMACLGIWLLFIMQLLLEYAHMNKNKKQVGADGEMQQGSIKQIHENPAMSNTDLSGSMADRFGEEKTAPVAATQVQVTDDADNASTEEMIYADESLGWVVSVGDCLHNFADGMAIGASYAVDLGLGLSTTIAIFFHEIPHEFGDVAVMLSAGWKVKRILLMQAFTQSMALLGLFIGIPVAQIDGATEWILALAAGLFLYVALSNVIPELVEYFKTYDPWKVFLWANIGIGVGYAVMLIIAIFEGSISI